MLVKDFINKVSSANLNGGIFLYLDSPVQILDDDVWIDGDGNVFIDVPSEDEINSELESSDWFDEDYLEEVEDYFFQEN